MLEARLDTMWIMVSAVLVMSMQLGFCMLESGLVRSKNTINVAIKILLDFCMAGLLYWALAFGLMFGKNPTGWLGTNDFFFEPGIGAHDFPFFLFQLMFCATTATIVSGAVAERMRFSGYLMLTVIVSAFIYPIAGSWAWNPDGWLSKLGFVDFAGSMVVHSTGGWVAFAAIAILGARKGRFDSRYPLSSAHSLGVATFGVLVLFVAWLGFNGGSTFALNESVPLILTNTVLSGCAGCLVALAFTWIRKGLPLLPPTLNGCIAGLVAISAGCHCVRVWEAFVIGAIGGLVCCLGLIALEKLKLDDSVGASAAHALPGAWGAIAVALFGDPALIKTGLEFWPQLKVQLLGVGVFTVWAAGVGWVLFWLLNKVYRLRVSEESERVGLNVSEHGASTEIVDLLNEMERHGSLGEFSLIRQFTPYSEVGQIAGEYNRVINKIISEQEMNEAMTVRLRAAQQAAERTNRKILDSLEYAKSIQRAILPPKELLDRLLPEHFAIYRPRDWVSGDFYWCLESRDSIFLAVVDCTGHGVPGAFMSMIGNVLLEQIVTDREVRDPALILGELHERVRAVLGQDGANPESQDGMDVCLLRIDSDSVHFAGAGRPLWFVSAGSRVLREIPGERHSVGGGRHGLQSLNFQSHRLPRNGPLSLYLSSDGVTDQPNHLREPFDKARLRELILRGVGQPMEVQGAEFERAMEEFQGGAEQRDDITLLGIRI